MTSSDSDTGQKADKDRLNTGDKALLEAAKTGRGAVALTPELVKEIAAKVQGRLEDIERRFPVLVAECPYETRLAVTAWVFAHICAHAREGGTYRYLIYDRLGFGSDAYVPLYDAGGMEISNEFDLTEPPDAA